MKKRIFSNEEKEKIIEMNKQHYSYKVIATELSCSYETLRKYMESQGIKKTISYLKNHNLNESYFENINTEEKAYFLGLLKTDGYIKHGKGNDRIGIQLKREDEYMVEKFKNALNANNLITKDNRVGKEGSSVEISSQKICKDLSIFEIVPNKTYLLNDIRIDLISEELQRHYLRGLLDGDGTIWIEKETNTIGIGFCGYNENFVRSFQLAIDKILDKEEHNKILKSNAYTCRWKGNQISKKILNYLYADSSIFLERKKKFYDLLKDK